MYGDVRVPGYIDMETQDVYLSVHYLAKILGMDTKGVCDTPSIASHLIKVIPKGKSGYLMAPTWVLYSTLVNTVYQADKPVMEWLHQFYENEEEIEVAKVACVPAVVSENSIEFMFDGHMVRTVIKDGEPWFLAKDVAELLGYSNTAKAIADHCKGSITIRYGTSSKGGNPNVTIIHERDVFRLVFQSKLPAAERFEEWVVGEVLPSIRKTGSYAVPKTRELALAEAVLLANSMIQEQQLLIERMEPKEVIYDLIMNTDDLKPVNETAKKYGIGRNTLFKLLRDRKVLMDKFVGHPLRHVPYQQYIDAGYFQVKDKYDSNRDTTYHRTYFTQRGVDWLGKKLIEWGKIPKLSTAPPRGVHTGLVGTA